MKISEIIRVGSTEYLSEAPMIVGDEDWDLNSVSGNQTMVGKLMKGSNVHLDYITEYNGLDVWRYRKQIFAISPQRKSKKLVYWIKFETPFISAINTQVVTQRALWRDSTSQTNAQIAKYVFFNVLLDEYKVIATDSLQTHAGMRFWTLRVDEALSKNLNVYVLDMRGTPTTLTKVLDIQDFENMNDHGLIWGTIPAYKKNLVIISSTNLTPTDDVEFNY